MKKAALVLAIVVLAAITATAVLAGTISFTGTLVPGGATEPQVALITTPNCNGGTIAFTMLYHAYRFTVDAAGVYTVTEPGVESAVYVYAGGFDPVFPALNCIAASNTNPISLPVNLSPGVVYTLVVVEDTFEQDGMPYNLTINGPGNISVPVDNCASALPAGSTVRSVPLGAPAYYAPDLATRVTFDLPAGTWWVTRTSGDFAQVWIACNASPVWIPVSALGG